MLANYADKGEDGKEDSKNWWTSSLYFLYGLMMTTFVLQEF